MSREAEAGVGAGFALAEAGLARLSHVSLEVAELAPALTFYREVFGLQTIFERRLEGAEFEAVTATPGARSHLVRGLVAGQAVVQLFWHSWRAPASEKRTLMSFEVRDIERAHAVITARGVPTRSAPVEFDNSWAFVLEDPDGHPIELIQWKPQFQPYRAG